MIIKELLALNEEAVKKAKSVKLTDRVFVITKPGRNGGEKGEEINSEWFTDTDFAPYYLSTGERYQIKRIEVGEEGHISCMNTGYEIDIKRIK